MTTTSDLVYGRQGGRLTEWQEPRAGRVTVLRMPVTDDELWHHLTHDHAPFPASVLDAFTPADWANWHAAEHRNRRPVGKEKRHAGHLQHTHPTEALKSMGIETKPQSKDKAK